MPANHFAGAAEVCDVQTKHSLYVARLSLEWCSWACLGPRRWQKKEMHTGLGPPCVSLRARSSSASHQARCSARARVISASRSSCERCGELRATSSGAAFSAASSAASLAGSVTGRPHTSYCASLPPRSPSSAIALDIHQKTG